jgi:hypothetical protein
MPAAGKAGQAAAGAAKPRQPTPAPKAVVVAPGIAKPVAVTPVVANPAVAEPVVAKPTVVEPVVVEQPPAEPAPKPAMFGKMPDRSEPMLPRIVGRMPVPEDVPYPQPVAANP